ncbi:MAG: serine hydrolase domain-containing protein [Acidobacteriota bacterium]
MHRISTVIGSLLMTLMTVVPGALAEGPSPATAPSATLDFSTRLDDAIAAKHFAGVSAGLARRGEILWVGVAGDCNVKAQKACSPSTPMRIASIAKPMTAVAILQLHEKGALDLDAPIATYLTDYPSAAASKITTRHLLHHTAGIGGYKSNKERETVTEYESLAAASEVFARRDLLFEPGSSYSYSTYGYVVLGWVLESVSGKSYEAYLRENIWRPASMESTGVERFSQVDPSHSELYTKSKRGRIKKAKRNNLSNRIPGGGLYSTVEDLLRFGQSLLDGTLLSPESLAALRSYPDVERGSNNPYGVGFFIYQDDPERGSLIGHSGAQTGASGQLMILPERGVVVAVLSNTSRSWEHAIALSVEMIQAAVAETSE